MRIETRLISKIYGSATTGVSALLPTSFRIDEGEFISIVGPSGSGKSTLMNIIGLLDRPSSGQLLFNGMDCTSLRPDQAARIRNRHIGFIFQAYHLLARQTVQQNVELPLIYSGTRPAVRRRCAILALRSVALERYAERQPSQLSGGEQQRAAVARAMASNPSVILADEPTGALDSANGREVIRLLQRFNQEGKTVIVVTHDLEVARTASRTLAVRDGCVISDSALSIVKQGWSGRRRIGRRELI